MAQWRYVMSIYSENILWLFTVLSVFLIIVIVYLYSGFEKQPRDLIECIVYAIGAITNVSQPIQKYCTKTVCKYLACMSLLNQLAIITLHNAYFLNVIMIPRYPNNIETINDVLLHKMPFVTTFEISVRKRIPSHFRFNLLIFFLFFRNHFIG